MRLSFPGNPSAQAQVEAALRERLPGWQLCGAASAPPGLREPPGVLLPLPQGRGRGNQESESCHGNQEKNVGGTSVLNAAVKTRTAPSTLDLTLTGAISRYHGDKIQLKLRENHRRRMHGLQ